MNILKNNKNYDWEKFGKQTLAVIGIMFSYFGFVKDLPGKTLLGIILSITLISFIFLYETRVFSFNLKYKAPIRNSMLMIFSLEIFLLVDYCFKFELFFNKLYPSNGLSNYKIVLNEYHIFYMVAIIIYYFLIHKLFLDYSLDTYRTPAKDSNFTTLFCVYILILVFLIDIVFKLGILLTVDKYNDKIINFHWTRFILCIIAIAAIWLLTYTIVNSDLQKKMEKLLNESKEDK